MARWQPPIPYGTLYSEDAIKLGKGLALLGWCYDRVDRDGWIEVRLEVAANDIGQPYGTIRDWWRLLRASDFVGELIDCGRNGWKLRMKSEWIDWRIMKHNYPDKQEPSTQTERRNTSVETIEDVLNVPSTILNAVDERRNTSVEGNAYKVLHTDQESITHIVAANAATPIPVSKPRKPKPPKPDEPPTPSSIRMLIADLCSIDLDGKTASEKQVKSLNLEAKKIWVSAQNAGKNETECLEAIRYVSGWIRRTIYPYSNGQPLTPFAIRERWRAAIDARTKAKPYANGSTNGVHPANELSQEEQRRLSAEAARALPLPAYIPGGAK